MKKHSFLCLTLLVVLISGCVPGNQKQTVELSDTMALKGVLLRYQDGLWFQPCWERLWWPVTDMTAAAELQSLYRKFSVDDAVELYAEIEGAVESDQDNRLQVRQLNLLGGGRDTCNFSLKGLEFRAASSAPYWVADIRERRISIKSVKPMGSYNFFTRKQPDEVSGAVIYSEITPTSQPLEMILIRQRCEDAVTGTILPYRAQMQLFGHRYDGCARKGQDREVKIAGLYWFEGRDNSVMLRLLPDRKVQLVRQGLQGKAFTERGSWQYLDSGKLILSMRDSQQNEFILLLRKLADGSFRLQTPEQVIPTGARFARWQPSGLEGGTLLRQVERASGTDARAALPVKDFASQPVTPARVEDHLVNEIIVSE